MRTNVYVDAFNLYYGCLKGTPYRWLNLELLCQLLLPQNTIQHIKYYTARVAARPSDPQQPVHQETYLRALRTLAPISIYYGHFLTHTLTMPVAHPPPAFETVIKTEEKGSDVNLAT